MLDRHDSCSAFEAEREEDKHEEQQETRIRSRRALSGRILD